MAAQYNTRSATIDHTSLVYSSGHYHGSAALNATCTIGIQSPFVLLASFELTQLRTGRLVGIAATSPVHDRRSCLTVPV